MKSKDIEILREMPIYVKHLIVGFYWGSKKKTVSERLMEAVNRTMAFLKKKDMCRY